MTTTAQRPGDETERQFGWQDISVGPDADPRGIGGIFVHHGDERTVLAGYLHDYRLTLELKRHVMERYVPELVAEDEPRSFPVVITEVREQFVGALHLLIVPPVCRGLLTLRG